MSTAFAPSSQAVTAASSVPSLTRLFLVEVAAGLYQFSQTGPADASLTLNGAGQYEIDPLSTAKLAKSGTGDLIVYGS